VENIDSLRFDDSGRALTIVRVGRPSVRWRLRPKHAATTPAMRETALGDGRIKLTRGKRTIGDPVRPLDPSVSARLSADHRWLLSVSSTAAEIWNAGSEDVFHRPLTSVFSLAAADGATTALAPLVNSDISDAPDLGTIELRRPGGPPIRLRPRSTGGRPQALAFGPGRGVITALYSGTRRELWRDGPGGWKPTASSSLGPRTVGALAPDGRHALLMSGGNRLELWDLSTTPPSSTPLPAAGSADGLAFAGDGRSFAYATSRPGCTLAVYRIPPRRPVCVRASLGGGFKLELALNHDGTVLATSNAAGDIAFWNTSRGTRVPVPVVANFAAFASKPLDDFGLGQQPAVLAFAPDGRSLLAHDVERGTMRFIDVNRQQPIGIPLPAPQAEFGSTDLMHRFASDGSRLLVTAAAAGWFGVTEVSGLAWSRDANAFRERICRITGGGLTATQWRQLDISVPYAPQC
jgi:WD40 repeat protein